MTTLWRRIAIGVALVAAVGTITLVALPGRLLAAGMMGGNMGGMMQSGTTSGEMNSMMRDGMMGAMMNGGHMGAMMQMMGGDMSGMHDGTGGMHGQDLSAAAGALGMTSDELVAALVAGRGVADLAKERGVDLSAVSGAMATARDAALDQLVAAGTLTQEQADQMLNHMNRAGFSTLNGAAMMQAGGPCNGAQPKTN